MRSRRLAGVAVVAALALFGAACSSDDTEDTTTTTASESDSGATESGTDEGGEGEGSGEESVSDDEYVAAIDDFRGRVEAAGDDVCALIEVQTEGSPPEPANSAQVEQAIGLYADLLRAMGKSIESEKPESAAAFDTAANELLDEAKAADYSVEFMTGSAPKALESDAIVKAQTDFMEVAQACVPEMTNGAGVDGVEAPDAG